MSVSVAHPKSFGKLGLDINRSWIFIWLILAVLLSISLLISKNYQFLWLVWGQAALAIFAQWILVLPRSWLAKGLFVSLIIVMLLSIFGWFYNANGFYETDHFWSSLQNPSLTAKVIKGQGSQNWQIEPDQSLSWTFEARLLEGQPGWDWRQNGNTVDLVRMQDKAGIFTRATVPNSGEELYLSRQFQLDQSAKGRTFKFYVGLRSLQSSASQAYITTTSGGKFPVSFSPDWRLFQGEWTAESDTEQIRILLRNLNGLELDVRELHLFELVENAWVDLGSGFGSDLRMMAKTNTNFPLTYEDALPSTNWQTYTLDIPANDAKILTTSLLLGDGLSLQVRNSKLAYETEANLAPQLLARDTRQRLWFSNENFLAHTVTAAGLVFLLAVNSLSMSVLGYLALLITVLLTGSRTALLVACIGGWLLLTLLFRRRQSMKLYYGLLFFAGTFLITSFIRFGPNSLEMLGLNTKQVVSRFDIWKVAWDGLLHYPLKGLPGQDFASYFAKYYPDSPDTLHAHNFWLDFAVRYGIFGFLASLLLSLYFLIYAWLKGRWTGLVLVLSFLVLQLFDVTLLFSGVLLFLILGFNVLSKIPNKAIISNQNPKVSDKPL